MREFINTLRSRKWKILNKADIKMKKGSHRKQGQCRKDPSWQYTNSLCSEEHVTNL